MSTSTVKTTCLLDAETERELESLAGRWGTSRSAALRRAIRLAAKQARSDGDEAIEALDRLQSLLGLDQETAGLWADEVRQECGAALRNTSWTEK